MSHSPRSHTLGNIDEMHEGDIFNLAASTGIFDHSLPIFSYPQTFPHGAAYTSAPSASHWSPAAFVNSDQGNNMNSQSQYTDAAVVGDSFVFDCNTPPQSNNVPPQESNAMSCFDDFIDFGPLQDTSVDVEAGYGPAPGGLTSNVTDDNTFLHSGLGFEMHQQNMIGRAGGQMNTGFEFNGFQYAAARPQLLNNNLPPTPESLGTPAADETHTPLVEHESSELVPVQPSNDRTAAKPKEKGTAKGKAKGEGAKKGAAAPRSNTKKPAGVKKSTKKAKGTGVPAKRAPSKRKKAVKKDAVPEALMTEEEKAQAALIKAELEQKSHFSSKERRANKIVKQQKQEAELADQMGSNITVTHTSIGGKTMQGVFWKNPEPDATIPTTPEEMETCFTAILLAIMNNKGCRENEDTQQFLNRWGSGAAYYSINELLMVAQEILTTVVDVHRVGWTKSVYDKDQRKMFQKTMYYTFEERFSMLIELLTVSKRSCADIFKGERLYTIVGNPGALITRTKSNKSSNGNKAIRIATGTKLENEKGVQLSGEALIDRLCELVESEHCELVQSANSEPVQSANCEPVQWANKRSLEDFQQDMTAEEQAAIETRPIKAMRTRSATRQ
ncbi:hypothetical protein ACN47E_000927 [Coniothyrium glycines]